MQAESAPMIQQYPSELALFINGSWRSGEGRETLVVRNPASGAGIADLPVATPADLEEALAAAEQGFREWRALDVDTRGAILRKAAAGGARHKGRQQDGIIGRVPCALRYRPKSSRSSTPRARA